jgi:hypothetical protein
MATNPDSNTTSSVVRTGTDTVTGAKISRAVASVSTVATIAKTLQNNGIDAISCLAMA